MVLRVTTNKSAIPTKEVYQEGGAPNAIISERTAVKKNAPKTVPKIVPLPPVKRVPPTTTAAIDSSSSPVPSETLVWGSLARVAIADKPANTEQIMNAQVFTRLPEHLEIRHWPGFLRAQANDCRTACDTGERRSAARSGVTTKNHFQLGTNVRPAVG
jgi:hypothetical protein